MDAVAIATLTCAVSAIAEEFVKGGATEAGKAAWVAMRSALKWKTDPPEEEIPQKVAQSIVDSPAIGEQLLNLLKQADVGVSRAIDRNINARGGNVVVAQTIKGRTVNIQSKTL